MTVELSDAGREGGLPINERSIDVLRQALARADQDLAAQTNRAEQAEQRERALREALVIMAADTFFDHIADVLEDEAGYVVIDKAHQVGFLRDIPVADTGESEQGLTKAGVEFIANTIRAALSSSIPEESTDE